MQKRWNILRDPAPDTGHLQQALNISRVLCRILTQRGISSFDAAKAFFRPELDNLHDPWLMKDMDKAVNRVLAAVEAKENILVFGDYDVDGTTSVAMVFQFLKSIYPKVDFYIPHRYREGYGVSKQGIDYAAETGCSLIISLDCGIKSVDLIGYARSLDIDFIVCDHHLPDASLPPAVAILNPKQPDCNYPYKELCGCGVGFKLLTALSKTLHLPDETFLKYLDLVATAIAADIVPMTGENRLLAYYGLKQVNTAPCPGIQALMKLAGQQKEMTISSLVFLIAPRINAAGRMDDAKKAVQLFIEQDPEMALQIAENLHQDNSDRKEADSSITEEALELIRIDPLSDGRVTTVVYQEHWHKGVVGIVASRLIESYYRPTIVLTKSGDYLAGSARSVPGFNLYEAIHACRDNLLGYGGHFAAAGMTLLPEKLEAFRVSFETAVKERITPELLIPEIRIDAEIQFSEITPGFYNILKQMEPFGPENSRPVFIARRVRDTGFSRIVKELHLRFVLKQEQVTLTGIGFNMADKFPLLQQQRPIDIVFTIEENEWQGEKSLQLKMLDLRESE